MNGPEHYAHAAEMLAQSEAKSADMSPDVYDRVVATAQVHATLAVAAATAGLMLDVELPAWEEVTQCSTPTR